jgi:hypothetical protein
MALRKRIGSEPMTRNMNCHGTGRDVF